VWQECRTSPNDLRPALFAGGGKYALHTLTKGLPGFVSSAGSADAAKNVTAADNLPPISAPVLAYDSSSLHDKGNGVQ
jgi:hypothetical protein